jgi:hypothetical protein
VPEPCGSGLEAVTGFVREHKPQPCPRQRADVCLATRPSASLDDADDRSSCRRAPDARNQRQADASRRRASPRRQSSRPTSAFWEGARQDPVASGPVPACAIAHKRARARAPIQSWRSRACVGKRRVLHAVLSPALDSARWKHTRTRPTQNVRPTADLALAGAGLWSMVSSTASYPIGRYPTLQNTEHHEVVRESPTTRCNAAATGAGGRMRASTQPSFPRGALNGGHRLRMLPPSPTRQGQMGIAGSTRAECLNDPRASLGRL